jgi:hypothetical protein
MKLYAFALLATFTCSASWARETSEQLAQEEPRNGRRLVNIWNILFLGMSVGSFIGSRECKLVLYTHLMLIQLTNPIYSIYHAVNPHACPPFGKPHDDCVANANAASNRNSSGTSATTSYSSQYSTVVSNGNSASSSSSSSTSNSGTNTSGSGTSASSILAPVMLVAAAAAAVAALAAVVLGQRQTEPVSHPLRGSVGRRMGLFSAFADSAIGRPNRVVEMSHDDGATAYSNGMASV